MPRAAVTASFTRSVKSRSQRSNLVMPTPITHTFRFAMQVSSVEGVPYRRRPRMRKPRPSFEADFASSLGENPEPFAACGFSQSLVERHERLAARLAARPQQGGRKLKGAGSAESMHREQALGPLSQPLAGDDFGPGRGQREEYPPRLRLGRGAQAAVTAAPGQGGEAFDPRRPPHDDRRGFLGEAADLGAGRLRGAQRDDLRGGPGPPQPP